MVTEAREAEDPDDGGDKALAHGRRIEAQPDSTSVDRAWQSSKTPRAGSGPAACTGHTGEDHGCAPYRARSAAVAIRLRRPTTEVTVRLEDRSIDPEEVRLSTHRWAEVPYRRPEGMERLDKTLPFCQMVCEAQERGLLSISRRRTRIVRDYDAVMVDAASRRQASVRLRSFRSRGQPEDLPRRHETTEGHSQLRSLRGRRPDLPNPILVFMATRRPRSHEGCQLRTGSCGVEEDVRFWGARGCSSIRIRRARSTTWSLV